ncbi:putative pre-mRNA-splicing factor ATP-dependent RNA helicase DEAH2 [Diplonema papillatum]|nr:putative pre-mRNA-splicing factor ATP-dependent RNA helicase DEAH2 [Diplonema papillatum]
MTERKQKIDLGDGGAKKKRRTDEPAAPAAAQDAGEAVAVVPLKLDTGGVNPYTNLPFSAAYFEILEKRNKLSVWGAQQDFAQLVEQFQVVLLVGETGSGKTTQILQFCVDLAPDKAVACTQPRRVAAMSVAQRVANELGSLLT